MSYKCLGAHVFTYLALTVSILLLVAMVTHAQNGFSDGFGHAVLVTGCDSGFGHHLAKKLEGMGFTVFAGCLCPEGPGAQRLVNEGSERMKMLQLDVTKDEDVKSARDFVKSNLPEKGNWSWALLICEETDLILSPCLSVSSGLYAVVNNAGVSDWGEIEWSTSKDFQKMIDVNLQGPIRVTIAFLSMIRATKGVSMHHIISSFENYFLTIGNSKLFFIFRPYVVRVKHLFIF